MNKRGISQIIATVLILLLILVAIVIIWSFVRPAITKTGEYVNSADCITLSLEVSSCEVIDNSFNVNVKRNAGAGDLQGIRFLFADGTVINQEPLAELESRTFSLEIPSDTSTANVAALIGESLQVCNPQSSPKNCK